jgi:alginate O-acetyltransferase complex protein AlgI
VVAVITALLVFTLLTGFVLTRLRPGPLPRALGWILVLGAAGGAERLSANEPAGVRMLAICAVTLWAMKGIVTIEHQIQRGERLPAIAWFAFAAGWPGMRPVLFASMGKPVSGAGDLLLRGALRLGLGAALIGLAHLSLRATGSRVLATALLLPGVSLVLHFGLFNLGAGTWRLFGVPATPLFDAPLASTSLTEFWGRRWNIAFTEMCQLAVYRPLSPLLGRGTATAAAFAFSALLHELAISVPVKSGYGLPLAYFALHGALTVGEKKLAQKGQGLFARSPWAGRIWTLAWLAVPMPILFHPAFLREVLWPLIGAH